jgi:hypothetical protein
MSVYKKKRKEKNNNASYLHMNQQELFDERSHQVVAIHVMIAGERIEQRRLLLAVKVATVVGRVWPEMVRPSLAQWGDGVGMATQHREKRPVEWIPPNSESDNRHKFIKTKLTAKNKLLYI